MPNPVPAWTCPVCQIWHEELPLCFGWEAPWRLFVPEHEFDDRVELTEDLCVIDEKIFLIRGHIEIPMLDTQEPAAFSVWASVSLDSFKHAFSRWEAMDREHDAPYFGWMMTEIPLYPSTLHLKLSVQSRAPGTVPAITVEPTEHPLAVDQHHGITMAKWHEVSLALCSGTTTSEAA